MLDETLNLVKPPKDLFLMSVIVANQSEAIFYQNDNALIDCNRTLGGMSLIDN